LFFEEINLLRRVRALRLRINTKINISARIKRPPMAPPTIAAIGGVFEPCAGPEAEPLVVEPGGLLVLAEPEPLVLAEPEPLVVDATDGFSKSFLTRK
jgi:hypothetical protein